MSSIIYYQQLRIASYSYQKKECMYYPDDQNRKTRALSPAKCTASCVASY